MSHENIAYCSILPVVSNDGTSPGVYVNGIVVASDDSLVTLGPSGSKVFAFPMPLSYRTSLESLKDQVLTMINSTYQMSLTADVIVFPEL